MQQDHNDIQTAGAMPEPVAPSGSGKRIGTLSAFAVVGMLGLFFLLGVWPRLHAGKAIADEQKDMRPNVVVVGAQRAKANVELTLPGTLLPIQEALIYARTNGYVKQWKVDIGAQVKQGQLLAEIETPEIDRELKQALLNLRTDINHPLLHVAVGTRVDQRLLNRQQRSGQRQLHIGFGTLRRDDDDIGPHIFLHIGDRLARV